jgi:hypothetical protein
MLQSLQYLKRFLAHLAKGNVSFCHRGEDLKKICQSETRIACGGHACQWIGTK